MKAPLIACLVFGFSVAAFAQSAKIETYHKKSGAQVFVKDSADYVRVIHPRFDSGTNYRITEHYLDGTPRLDGNASEIKPVKFEGEVLRFDGKGRKTEAVNYVSGKRVGEATYFYANGKLKKKVLYSQLADSKNISKEKKELLSFYDSTGVQKVVKGTGHVRELTEGAVEEGEYVNGFKNGSWKGENVKERTSYEESYANGELVSGTSVKDGKTFTYTEISQLPKFDGGEIAFGRFIQRNFKYPKDALEFGVNGKVYVQFVVLADGAVAQVNVVQPLTSSINAEAMRVLKISPRWIPGTQRGIPVKVLYTVPISIKAQQ